MTFERLFSLAASAAGLLGLYMTIYPLTDWSTDKKFFYAVSYLALIIFALLSFILVRELGKTHRYAQSVYFTHFVNHVIRDFIDAAISGKNPSLQDASLEIAEAVATCFTVLTGRKCRCAIKELTKDADIVTLARDALSRIQTTKGAIKKHPLSKNSDFEDIWYGRNGCYRYHFCNDLIREYKKGKYKNSSFEIYGEPEIAELFGFVWVKNWMLPYRSTIIWPIRHIPSHDMWPPDPQDPPAAADAPRHWGFLCVDSDARNSFDWRYAPELGAAFADALYTLYSVSAYYARQNQQATQADPEPNHVRSSL